MRHAEWLQIGDALNRILEAMPRLDAERVPLLRAGGRVLAEPAISPLTLPPWDNSGMDGYAVHAADVARASPATPVRLHVVGEVAAGEFPDAPLDRGAALRIMTGAPIPAGCDTVIRVEHTKLIDAQTVEVFNAMDLSQNIRPAGEDVKAGETVLQAGIVLRPAEIGVLASIGVASPSVARKPRVGILSTGNELVDLDDAAAAVAGRAIINSNSYALAAGVAATASEPVLLGIARDDAGDLHAKLRDLSQLDALITTAGASVGAHDLVKDVMEELGLRVHFWRVQMRPGSPFSFGTIERPGRAPLPVFGLPGNPVSALVTFELLVRPGLRRMMGRSAVHPHVLRVRCGERFGSKPGMTHFLRASLERGADLPVARLKGAQGSGILTSMARADALLVVPLDEPGIAEGEEAAAVLLQAGDDAQDYAGY